MQSQPAAAAALTMDAFRSPEMEQKVDVVRHVCICGTLSMQAYLVALSGMRAYAAHCRGRRI
eukprot:SAG31_NODE_4707_length_3019_cov_1.720205_4_plen_62_part_00